VIPVVRYRWYVTETDPRTRIVESAAQLLREHGPAAVTTRGVAEAAGVQPPAIYRLFGDKDGLLDAVAEHVMTGYVTAKAAQVEAASAEDVDPVEDLRAGWDRQIDFGVGNPTLFRLLSDPDRVRPSPAAQQGREVLAARISRVAAVGRLRVSEQRAVAVFQAAGIGAIHVLLATPAEQRDPGLADALFAAVLREVLTDAPAAADTGPMAATVAFRAVAPQLDVLTPGEQHLLGELLDRAVDALAAAPQRA
jgi:AcrR family transcriptional regulator